MCSIYSVFNEPYMRLWNLARKQKLTTLPDRRLNLEGRPLPTILRQDEAFIYPSFTKSYDCLAYLLSLYLWCENCDYQMSSIINHFLQMARRFNYEGKWKIWFDLAEYFELEVVQGEKELTNGQRSRSSSGPNDQKLKLSIPERKTVLASEREATIFSYMNFVEFLLTQMSEDDLFGNLFRRATKFAITIRIENSQHYHKRLSERKVRRTIRHRGYRDKGTLPDPDQSARKDANRLTEQEPRIKYDSLNQVIDWGRPLRNPSGGG